MSKEELTIEQLELMLEEQKQSQGETQSQSQEAPMQNVVDLPVTTLEDLGEYSKGQKVRFPDFQEGQPFVALVKRPSLLVLSKQGKIPNRLLNSATSMFTGESQGGSEEDSANALNDMYDVIEIVAESTLIKPTYEEIKNAGIQLSDNQLMAIFNYTQNGVKALESFR